MYISRYAEVGALYGDQAEEVGRYRGAMRLIGAGRERQRKDGVLFGGHGYSCLKRKLRQGSAASEHCFDIQNAGRGAK